MVLQHLNPDTIGIKTAQALVTIKHDGTIKIGDRHTEGPGEYDIAGVGVHAFPSHALLFCEGVRMAMVWGQGDLSDEDDTSTNVFIFLTEDSKYITNVIKEQDPRLVVLHNQAVADEVAKQDGVSVVQEGNYKLTAQSLPAEDRIFVLLG